MVSVHHRPNCFLTYPVHCVNIEKESGVLYLELLCLIGALDFAKNVKFFSLRL